MSEKVRTMFADIADDYDRINTVLSLGVHHTWRRKAIKVSGAKIGDHVLDCATGTGDLAIAFKKKVGKEGYVLGTDFCAPMIEAAPAKAANKGLEIDFEVADAMKLPYQDNRFDISSISFGIRNVDEPVTALREMARVVKPGGRVVVLEFGQPKGFIKYPYNLYSQHIMPAIGGFLSGHREAYTYLPRTSATFPAGKNFLKLMEEAKVFIDQTAYRLTWGVAYIYVGLVQ
jgi:demethylmenaquinone methyltransferase/2-methoxy-6-polyprenyl-1,4-benzoquinol methylase